MKKTIKKLIGFILLSTMLLSNSIVSFAASTDSITSETTSLEINMESLDLAKPHEISKQYVNENGDIVIIGAIYTPNEDYNPIAPLWSESYNAVVGTWTSYYDGSVACSMSYDFDVNRSGSHWSISNARNFSVHALISTVEAKELKINRAVSSASYAAEVRGQCTLKMLDTPLGSAATVEAWIKTTVNDAGTLTVSGN